MRPIGIDRSDGKSAADAMAFTWRITRPKLAVGVGGRDDNDSPSDTRQTHQYPTAQGVTQNLKKGLIIGGIAKDGVPRQATVQHMIDRARILNAER